MSPKNFIIIRLVYFFTHIIVGRATASLGHTDTVAGPYRRPHRRRTSPSSGYTVVGPHRRRAILSLDHTVVGPHRRRTTPSPGHTVVGPYCRWTTPSSAHTVVAPRRRRATLSPGHTVGRLSRAHSANWSGTGRRERTPKDVAVRAALPKHTLLTGRAPVGAKGRQKKRSSRSRCPRLTFRNYSN